MKSRTYVAIDVVLSSTDERMCEEHGLKASERALDSTEIHPHRNADSSRIAG